MNTLAVCIAAIFGIAAISKFLALQDFSTNLRQLGFPKLVAPALALVVPVLELAVTLLLLAPNSRLRFEGSMTATVLATLFVALQVWIKLKKKPSCQCFGALDSSSSDGSSPTSWTHLFRALALAIGSWLLLAFGAFEEPYSVFDFIVGILLSLTFLVLIALSKGLHQLFVYRDRLRKELGWDPYRLASERSNSTISKDW